MDFHLHHSMGLLFRNSKKYRMKRRVMQSNWNSRYGGYKISMRPWSYLQLNSFGIQILSGGHIPITGSSGGGSQSLSSAVQFAVISHASHTSVHAAEQTSDVSRVGRKTLFSVTLVTAAEHTRKWANTAREEAMKIIRMYSSPFKKSTEVLVKFVKLYLVLYVFEIQKIASIPIIYYLYG